MNPAEGGLQIVEAKYMEGVSSPELRAGNFTERSDEIWKTSYKKSKHAEARQAFGVLLQEAKDAGADRKEEGKILVRLGWSTYHDDRLSGIENTAHALVEGDIEQTEDSEIRSDLYQIAGLSLLANGKEVEAKGLLELSLKHAKDSGSNNTIGAAKNGLGIELNKQGAYTEAIDYLTDAAKLHEHGKDNMRAGNAWSNLVVSYAGNKDLGSAREAANKALVLYDNPTSHHSFGVRSRLATALVELGNEQDFVEAVKLLETQVELRTGDSDPDFLDEKTKMLNTQDQEKIKAIQAKIEIEVAFPTSGVIYQK
jgi:tetratricopeptide (TPR) repeat protein